MPTPFRSTFMDAPCFTTHLPSPCVEAVSSWSEYFISALDSSWDLTLVIRLRAGRGGDSGSWVLHVFVVAVVFLKRTCLRGGLCRWVWVRGTFSLPAKGMGLDLSTVRTQGSPEIQDSWGHPLKLGGPTHFLWKSRLWHRRPLETIPLTSFLVLLPSKLCLWPDFQLYQPWDCRRWESPQLLP